MTAESAQHDENAPAASHSLSPAMIFWVAAVLLLFWGLGVEELWKSESRWAEITRNMVHEGNYFHPELNGEPYFKKPLLGYWTIAVASMVTGSVDEWSIRLPSAVAGLLTLATTVSLGRRFWSAPAGWIAGWLLLTSYGFLFWSRTGQSDMANVAFIMLAITWYWSRRDRGALSTWMGFYVICSVGAQMKGLGAIAVPCLAVLPDLLRHGRWKQLLTLTHLAAVALGSLVYLAPFLIEMATRAGYGGSGLRDVFEQNVLRFFSPFDHQGSFYIYFYELPILFLPWAPLLVLALVTAVARARKWTNLDYPTRWTVEASLLILAFFMASGSRRDYYILPLLPFCALMCARFLVSRTERNSQRVAIDLQATAVLAVSLIGVIAAAALALVNGQVQIELPPHLLTGLAGFSLLAGMPWVLHRISSTTLVRVTGIHAKLAVPVLGAAALMFGYFCFGRPTFNTINTTRTFVHLVRNSWVDPCNLAFYQVSPTRIAEVSFYLHDRDEYPVLQTPQEVIRFLSDRPGVNCLLLSLGAYESLEAELPAEYTLKVVSSETALPWERRSGERENWVLIRMPRLKHRNGEILTS